MEGQAAIVKGEQQSQSQFPQTQAAGSQTQENGTLEKLEFCFRWSKYASNLIATLDDVQNSEEFADCTIVVDDFVHFKAHRIVLAASSSFFNAILHDVTDDECKIMIPGINSCEMQILLDYMYKGEISLMQDALGKIMKIARELKIKGLHTVCASKKELKNSGITIDGKDEAVNSNCESESNYEVPTAARSEGNLLASAEMSSLSEPPACKNDALKRKITPSVSSANPLRGVDEIETPFKRKAVEPNLTNFRTGTSNNQVSENVYESAGANGVNFSGISNSEKNRRYKKYTDKDIALAMQSISKGLSTVKASREFGVPLRTLYDRVKKSRLASHTYATNSFPQGYAALNDTNSGDVFFNSNRIISDTDGTFYTHYEASLPDGDSQ